MLPKRSIASQHVKCPPCAAGQHGHRLAFPIVRSFVRSALITAIDQFVRPEQRPANKSSDGQEFEKDAVGGDQCEIGQKTASLE